MDDEESLPKPTAKAVPELPKVNWEGMSIEAITEYIGCLRTEISRAETEIQAKQKQRNVAENLFKG